MLSNSQSNALTYQIRHTHHGTTLNQGSEVLTLILFLLTPPQLLLLDTLKCIHRCSVFAVISLDLLRAPIRYLFLHTPENAEQRLKSLKQQQQRCRHLSEIE